MTLNPPTARPKSRSCIGMSSDTTSFMSWSSSLSSDDDAVEDVVVALGICS